jgi:hypothetical protein
MKPAPAIARSPASRSLDPAADTGLTKQRLASEFPGLAVALGEHDVLRLFRRAVAEGRGAVYVHVLPRE